MTETTASTWVDAEKADLLDALGKHRYLFMYTAQGLTDEQAALTPTASELSIGSLIKHTTSMERGWIAFIRSGGDAMAEAAGDWWANHHFLEGDTIAGLVAAYQEVAAETTALVESLPDLNVSHPLPEAPWFEPGTAWSARRVLVHLVAETAQHAGHADIIRETIDGQKSMG
ncbi:DUF664 domain-containing protein [Nakamurella sp. YIM 132087]|uniref:DUF664 domain-containing protein n=1 Tax=Nakamurella alba TaxID=2665158 RepID=A0A7K1FJK3_9ACTN|nr:DinB family protein [Nakamurella alba]MTD13619.1 DUF664 domain-containing protein [Nakamurella alba]